jgi:ribosomal protein S30
MIKNVIDILSLGDFYNQTERIDIAKGRYEYPPNLKSLVKYLKRIWYGSRSNRS